MTGFARATSIVLSLCLLSGCFTYHTRLDINRGERPFDDIEVAAAMVDIAEVARSFGLLPDRNFELLRRAHEEYDDIWDYHLIAEYVEGPHAETNHARIRLSLGVLKQTEQLVVVVNDLDHGSATDFTTRLEDALRGSLAARFPSYRIDVQRSRTFGRP